MRSFRQRNLTPPSGYTYRVPETGGDFEAGHLEALVILVRSHYVANKIEIPADLEARIEHDLCLRNPEDFCRGTYRQGDRQTQVVSTSDVKEATRRTTRLKWGHGDFLAPLEEAEARAVVCAGCTENTQGFCTTCNGLKAYVIDAIGDRKTSVDEKLGVCGVCKCLIRAKVWISKAALKAVTSEAEALKYPVSCWMSSLYK
jgi:hypothetical protein